MTQSPPPPPPATPPVPPAATPPPPPAPPAAPAAVSNKKKLSPWAWVGIGCGCLLLVVTLVLGVLGYLATKKVKEVARNFEEDPTRATAELFVGLNPDLELVDTTEDGRVTVRQVSSGEEMTLDLEDLKEGKLSFEGPDGEVTLDASEVEGGGTVRVTTDEGTSTFTADSSLEDVPDWVLLYPNATEVAGTFHSQNPQGVFGMVSVATDDSVDEVLEHYRDDFERQGFEVTNDTVTSSGGKRVGSLTGKDAAGRQLTVAVTMDSDQQVTVTLNYSGQP